VTLPGAVIGRGGEPVLAGFAIGFTIGRSGTPLLPWVALGRRRRTVVLPGIGSLATLRRLGQLYRWDGRRSVVRLLARRIGRSGLRLTLTLVPGSLGTSGIPVPDHSRWSRGLAQATLNRDFRVRPDLRSRVRRGRRPRAFMRLRTLSAPHLRVWCAPALRTRMRSTLRGPHSRRPGTLRSSDLGFWSALDLNLWSTLARAARPALFPGIAPRSLDDPNLRAPRRRGRRPALAGPIIFWRVRCRQIERFWTIWLEAPGTGGRVGRSVHACSLV
jgi:hypothetical protein